MRRVCVLFLFIYSLVLWAHEKPVNIGKSSSDQCGMSNHAGMGSILKNTFEAEIKLRKQCINLKKNNFSGGAPVCSTTSNMINKITNFDEDNIAYATAHVYFKNYAAKVFSSDILLAGGGGVANYPKCLGPYPGANAPHIQARASSLVADNIVSAGILMEIYNGGFLGFGKHHPYMNRLKESFPVLFNPEKRSSKLIDILEDSLGSKFSFSNNDGRDHSTIMDAFQALYDNNLEFKDKINNEVIVIKRKYRRHIRSKLLSLCTYSPMQLQKEHPGIFKQAILDMSDKERTLMNRYLCKQKEYYNPKRYDSDCDGVFDSSDEFPLDPFSPDADKTHKGTDVTDPPFGSNYHYNVKKEGDTINLSTNLVFDTSKMNDKDLKNFKSKMETCVNKLTDSMNESYKKLTNYNPQYNGKLDTQINLEFPEEDAKADFNVSKCFCSDCKDRVVDPDDSGFIFDNYIDHRTCWNDLTKTQKEAVTKVFPSGSFRWRDRQNSANLTVGTNCKTIKHEILHKFGLPDEYSDRESYPYNRIACNIMGDYSSKKSELIEGRHIEAIISPETCR